MDIKQGLLLHSDKKFRDFNARLMPTVDGSRILGVKTPALRAMARELMAAGEADAFMQRLPHEYFEEDQIHAFIISEIREWKSAVRELERFLPYVDNWASCDQMSLRAIASEPERALPLVDRWLCSSHTYTVRFGICTLMRYFLDERFDRVYLDRVAEIKTEQYYINMCSAWFFATALAKQYEASLPYFQQHRLSLWVHNKAIQKACESLRVSEEHKAELVLLKRSRG